MRILKASALTVWSLLGAVLLLGFFSLRGLPAAPGAGGAGAAVEGDVNCDGRVTVTDPILLLRYLFSQGPAPAACADSPDVVARLDTIAEKLDVLVNQFANPCRSRASRFSEMEKTIIGDGCTGLLWQEVRAGLSPIRWQDAVTSIGMIPEIGFGPWRLPTVDELATVVREGGWEPAADPLFGVTAQPYWTSTEGSRSPGDSAWVVDFSLQSENGARYRIANKMENCEVLAVCP
jgi:hypothetical protein